MTETRNVSISGKDPGEINKKHILLARLGRLDLETLDHLHGITQKIGPDLIAGLHVRGPGLLKGPFGKTIKRKLLK